MNKKFDCWTCKFKGIVPGSAHICCHHPSLEKVNGDPLLQLFAIFASTGRIPPIMARSKELNIEGDPHGIRNGWFNFPFNFDPTWLKNCDGYTPKEEAI